MKKWSLEAGIWAGLAGLFFSLLSLGQLQRLQLTPGIAIYGHDLVVLIGLTIVSWQRRTRLLQKLRQVTWKKWHVEIVLMAWIGLGWLIAFTQQNAVVVGILYTARLLAYGLFTITFLHAPFWQLLPAQWHGLKLQNWGYWLLGIAILYLGFLQYLLIPDTRFLGMIGWDNHYYRLIGPLLDPGFTGMILVITLLITTAIKARNTAALWGTKILLTVGIALTYSRASYLALGMGLLTLAGLQFWQKRKIVWEVILIGGLGILIFVIPKPGGEGVNLARTSTITSRVTSSQESVNDLSLAERLIGRGLFVPEKIESTNTQRPDFAKLPDNLLVLLFSNLGVLGAGLILLGVIKHRQLWHRLPTYIQAAVVATLVHSQFNNTLFQPFVFLILVGLTSSYWLADSET